MTNMTGMMMLAGLLLTPTAAQAAGARCSPGNSGSYTTQGGKMYVPVNRSYGGRGGSTIGDTWRGKRTTGSDLSGRGTMMGNSSRKKNVVTAGPTHPLREVSVASKDRSRFIRLLWKGKARSISVHHQVGEDRVTYRYRSKPGTLLGTLGQSLSAGVTK